MFKRILVPLDGSERAKSALAVAARIAHASGGSIILLQVIGVSSDYGTYIYESYFSQVPAFPEEALKKELAKANNYLETLAQSESLAGIQIETKVMDGTPAQAILAVTEEAHADLVVICSHGYTGMKRWLIGSVAQKVARHSTIPVLILHEQNDPTVNAPSTEHRVTPLLWASAPRALVGLDGSSLAERALEPAISLVSALASPGRGTVVLTKVVKTLPSPDSLGEQTLQLTDKALEDAEHYLSSIASTLQANAQPQLDCAVTQVATTGYDVADTLIKIAEDGKHADSVSEIVGSDLIVLATHGRGGIQRWVMGSVAERVLGSTRLPLLIVHPAPKAA